MAVLSSHAGCHPHGDPLEDNTMQIYGPAHDGRSTIASYGQRERGGESGAVVCGTA